MLYYSYFLKSMQPQKRSWFQRRKKHMQLQTHRDALEKVLEQLGKCIDKIDDPTFQLEVDIPLQDIVGGIFPEETGRLIDVLRETCNTMKTQLEELKNNYKACIRNIFMHTRKSRSIPSETDYREKTDCNLSAPLEKVMSTLLSTQVEVLGLFSRRSFEAAFLTAETFKDKLQQVENPNITEIGIRDTDKKCIHPVWSILTDNGCSLLAKMRNYLSDETIAAVIDTLSRMGSSIKVGELHDLIFTERKKELSRLVLKELKPLENFPRCVLIDYVTEHLQALGKTLVESGNVPLLDDLKYYLKVVFEDSCFLEYEVYAALLENGVPALPRVQLKYLHRVKSEEGEREKEIEEIPTDIDVVAAPRGDLWLIEVTKSDRQEKLEEDVNKLELLAGELGAEGALMVCTKSAREKAEKDIKTDKVLFIAFEDLYSELHRLFIERVR